MTGYRLSSTGRARHPYYLPDLARNLWSVEELCWLVTEYPSLIDTSITSKALTRWLVEEFAMTGTAIRMERGLKNNGSLADFLGPLLVDADYLTSQELRTFFQRLAKLEALSEPERLLRKADALARWRRFGQSIAVCQEAAGLVSRGENTLLAEIWHHCGVSAMQLLEYDEALSNFGRAWALTGSDDDRRDWLLALAAAREPEVFRQEALKREIPEEVVEKALAEAEKAYDEGTDDGPCDPSALSAEADELRAAYHREAGRADSRILP